MGRSMQSGFEEVHRLFAVELFEKTLIIEGLEQGSDRETQPALRPLRWA